MSVINKKSLKISSILYEFINKEVIPGTNTNVDDFWNKFEKAVNELAPINKSLIERRIVNKVKFNKTTLTNIFKI